MMDRSYRWRGAMPDWSLCYCVCTFFFFFFVENYCVCILCGRSLLLCSIHGSSVASPRHLVKIPLALTECVRVDVVRADPRYVHACVHACMHARDAVPEARRTHACTPLCRVRACMQRTPSLSSLLNSEHVGRNCILLLLASSPGWAWSDAAGPDLTAVCPRQT